ncbi:MAG: hypothetical protein UR26_C0004G0038 [candidate division TM6 bacterium GW2011_GWF2_32_72]|nr:MAG: hypothetical protein UR26_C0004G0038 [candidate division TM6 bacterium GW2011_GWF2_32_72]
MVFNWMLNIRLILAGCCFVFFGFFEVLPSLNLVQQGPVICLPNAIDASAELQQKTKNLQVDIFKKNIEKYYLNSSWILPMLEGMGLDDLTNSFSIYVQILRERPWFYFCNSKESYRHYKYYNDFIEQLQVMHDFITNNQFDIKADSVVNNDFADLGVPLEDLFKEYCSADYYDFYAFFCDQLSFLFVDSVNAAYEYVGTSEYLEKIDECDDIYYRIFDLIIKVKGSKYDNYYHMQISRYGLLLNFVDQEHKMLSETKKKA